MTRVRATELCAEGFLMASSGAFLAWYIWAKLMLQPAGIWPGP